MSSIPIPLQIRTPQNVDPLEQEQRAQGVVGMIQQQRLQQQQIAQNQFDLSDRKAGQDAMHEWDGKDIEDLPGLYIKHGATANAVLSLKNSILDQQTKRATLGKDLLDNDAKRHDNIAGAMNNAVVTNKDGSMNADATSQAVESLGRNQDFIRNLSPDEAQQLPTVIDKFKTQVSTDPDGFQRDWRVAANGHLAESAISANASKQAETASAQATAQKTASDTAKTNLENQTTQQKLDAYTAFKAKPGNEGKSMADFDVEQAGAKSGAEESAKLKAEQDAMGGGGATTQAMADAQYRSIQMKKFRGQPLTQNDQAAAAAYEKQKELVSTNNYWLQANGPGGGAAGANAGKTGDAYLATLPSPQAARVKAIAEGREPEPTGMAMRNPFAIKLMNDVYAYDPQWSSQRAQIRKAFTTGKDADNIGALNTAAVHLDALSEAAKALSNGTFRPGNAAWNTIQTMFGASAPTTFETIRNAVNGEQASALKGSATDIEIGNVAKSTNAANSPQQLADSIDKGSLPIMFQKLNTYKERYEQQIPGDKVYSPVLPSAAAAFAKHGVGGGAQAASGAQSTGHKVGDLVVQNGRTFKATAVDKDGKVTAADPQ